MLGPAASLKGVSRSCSGRTWSVPPKRSTPTWPTSSLVSARVSNVTASSAKTPQPFSCIDLESSTARTTCVLSPQLSASPPAANLPFLQPYADLGAYLTYSARILTYIATSQMPHPTCLVLSGVMSSMRAYSAL